MITMERINFYKETNFKDTEIGRIPEDWEVKTLREIGRVITGKTPSTKISEFWNGNIMFVTPTDYKGKKYIEETERYVTSKGANQSVLIPPYSVLTVCIASIGEVSINTKPCITNQQINAIIPFKESIEHEFLYYILKHRAKNLRLIAGFTTTPIVKKSTFEKFLIPLPPLEEQKAIAKVLKDFDDLLEIIDKQIEKLERIKKGLMNEYFTKGIFKHEKFKDTEIGRIPEDWETVRLGDIATFKNGVNFKKEEKNHKEGILMLDVLNMYEQKIFINPKKFYRVNKNITKEYLLEKGDILIVRSSLNKEGSAWASMFKGFNEPVSFNGFIIRIRLNDKNNINPEYITYYLRSHKSRKRLVESSGQTTISNVSQGMLKTFKIPLPSVEEQKAIAERLKNIDNLIETKQKEKERLERAKKKVMDLLLSGKVRVKN